MGFGPRCAAEANLELGRTYGRIFDLCFDCRTENGHEMALELVPGVDFRCVLHHLSRSWGQVWLESGPKPSKTKICILVS